MPLAYRALRLDTILSIVSAVLNEKHVVIVCKNRGVLSSVVYVLFKKLCVYCKVVVNSDIETFGVARAVYSDTSFGFRGVFVGARY